MSDIYQDGTYLQHNPDWHQEDSPWKADKIIELFEKNQLQPRSICEIGCGAGAILEQLADRLGDGVELSGYEISPQAFELCNTKTRDNLAFHRSDFFAESHGHLDVLMAIDVFEHIEDYLGFLRKLRDCATYKVFHIPLDLSMQGVLRGKPLIHVRQSIGHLHYFTKDTALASLKDTGYEVIDHFYTRGSIELNHNWRASLLRWPRSLLFAMSPDLTARALGGFSLMVLAK